MLSTWVKPEDSPHWKNNIGLLHETDESQVGYEDFLSCIWAEIKNHLQVNGWSETDQTEIFEQPALSTSVRMLKTWNLWKHQIFLHHGQDHDILPEKIER